MYDDFSGCLATGDFVWHPLAEAIETRLATRRFNPRAPKTRPLPDRHRNRAELRLQRGGLLRIPSLAEGTARPHQNSL